MVQFPLKTILAITLCFAIIAVNSYFYIGRNATKGFHNYRLWYKKHYENERDQARAFNNFVNNFNMVTDLNDGLVNSTKVYLLNQHADMNSEDFEEHYAVTIKPYDFVDREVMVFRTQTKDNKLVKDLKLYDLVKAEDLYKEYMIKFNKNNATTKKDRISRYYRFIKTLVELNKNILEGKTPMTLDDTADIVKEPNEYFFKTRD